MTNTELLAKIKAEIERLKSASNQLDYKNSVGFNWALDDVLSLLSTLESEKPINQDDLEEEIQSFWNRASGFQPKFATLEVKENGFATIARHFAQWGAEWQAKQDQETIELAEDHAYLAGAVNEREKMMKEAVEGRVFMSFAPGHNQMVMADVDLPTNTNVRVIVLPKEDNHE